jgi:hypothetical protein
MRTCEEEDMDSAARKEQASAADPGIHASLRALLTTPEVPTAPSQPSSQDASPTVPTQTIADLRRDIQAAEDNAAVEQLVAQLRSHGEGGQIDADTEWKLATIIKLRARELYHAEHPEDWSLSESARSGRHLRINSRVLGETILLLADNGQEPEGNNLTVYHASEARQLFGTPPEELRKVHEVKLAVDGELIEYDDESEARIYSTDIIRPSRPVAQTAGGDALDCIEAD